MANKKRPPSRGIGKDPYLSFRFKVKIGDNTVIGVNEVSGLSAETDVETLREGGVNTHEQQLIGPMKYPSKLTLKPASKTLRRSNGLLRLSHRISSALKK